MLAVLIVLGSFVALAVAGPRYGTDTRDGDDRSDRSGRCLDC